MKGEAQLRGEGSHAFYLVDGLGSQPVIDDSHGQVQIQCRSDLCRPQEQRGGIGASGNSQQQFFTAYVFYASIGVEGGALPSYDSQEIKARALVLTMVGVEGSIGGRGAVGMWKLGAVLSKRFC